VLGLTDERSRLVRAALASRRTFFEHRRGPHDLSPFPQLAGPPALHDARAGDRSVRETPEGSGVPQRGLHGPRRPSVPSNGRPSVSDPAASAFPPPPRQTPQAPAPPGRLSSRPPSLARSQNENCCAFRSLP
jgi:hypothetical protein